MIRRDALAGVLLGTAVGDALGLPRENVGRRRAARLFRTPLRHQFFFGRGMVSDDTEHTCLVGQALVKEPLDADRLARNLAWRLRGWLLALPCAFGRATVRGVGRLCLGFAPDRSGVPSAGNGPAMRAAILGVCLGGDPTRLRAFVRVSSRITHTDPRAERGALLVALAAHHGASHGPTGVPTDGFAAWVLARMPDADAELVRLLAVLDEHLQRRASVAELADSLGQRRGVSGYIYHTVPVAVYTWLRHPDDATLGPAAIPDAWLAGLLDWPFSVAWMQRLADSLTSTFGEEPARPGVPPGYFWPGLLVRNLGFLALVLVHAGRRLLPPY
jgi:ADP-ribosylglycohydrolase